MNYKAYAVSLLPRFMQTPRAVEQVQAAAAPLDDLVLRARTLMLARLVEFAPEEVLMQIGAERGIKRFEDEPLDTYRTRVAAAWRWWRMAGTLPGMRELLRLSGYSASIVEHYADPDRLRWAEFSITVTPLIPPLRNSQWGDQADRWSADDAYWGYKLQAVPLSSLVALIDEIKPAHARLRQLSFTLGDFAWGAGPRWGNEATPGAGHPWGSPWGLPSVTFGRAGGSESQWGEGRVQVLYDLNKQ